MKGHGHDVDEFVDEPSPTAWAPRIRPVPFSAINFRTDSFPPGNNELGHIPDDGLNRWRPSLSASFMDSPVLATLKSKVLKMAVPNTPGKTAFPPQTFVPTTLPLLIAVEPKGTQTFFPVTR